MSPRGGAALPTTRRSRRSTSAAADDDGAFFSGYLVHSISRNRHHSTFVSIIHPSSPITISLDFLPSSTSPTASIQIDAVSPHRGLLLCSTAAADVSYYVCKSATRQWRAIPNPRTRYRTAAAAILARPAVAGAAAAGEEFKIVRLSIPKLRDCLRCEVFDSRRNAWRRRSDVAVRPESMVETTSPPVRAHGAVMHWLRWPDHRGGEEDIFAFDMGNDTWRLIALPAEAVEKEKSWTAARKKLTAVEGKLCLVVAGDDDEVEIWVLVDYSRQKWEKKMTASLTRLAMEEGNSLILRDLYTSHIAIFSGVYTVLWYDFVRGIKIAEAPVRHNKCIQNVFKFESDFVPCEEIERRPDGSISKLHSPSKRDCQHSKDDVDKLNN
uniref:F-box associated beta-propeller type 1 domain-containing protein n=1 Tax=Leersia perrieri TaxID=77586 RepID=A0A0D9XAK1_9ORYZ